MMACHWPQLTFVDYSYACTTSQSRFSSTQLFHSMHVCDRPSDTINLPTCSTSLGLHSAA
jgi:hypothetical protein